MHQRKQAGQNLKNAKIRVPRGVAVASALIADNVAKDVVEPAFSLFSPEAKRFPLILTLDQNGIPHRWITWQHAVWYYAKSRIAWELGSEAFTVCGGKSRDTGEVSTVTAASIIAIRGKAMAMKGFNQVPPLNNRELFHRDRHMCGYCAGLFSHSKLTRAIILFPTPNAGRIHG